MLKKYSIFFLTLIFFASMQFNCKNGKTNDNTEIPDDYDNTSQVVVDEDAINEIIQSFSSPVEMAALMQSIDVPFSKKYLVDPKQTEDYDTNLKKALALGILSADLGYLNVYERTTLIVEYLTAIKKIADDLRVGQFFDFRSLKRLSTDGGNVDSLLFLSVTSFRDMDQHLRDNARSNLSLLIITGVWLEGLYLITQVSKEEPSEKLKERVGEQKTLFNILYNILKLYKSDKYFENIVKDFEKFHKSFNEVTITYEVGEPETKVIDGRVVIIQTDYSIVTMSDETLQDIIKITDKVRNKLINL